MVTTVTADWADGVLFVKAFAKIRTPFSYKLYVAPLVPHHKFMLTLKFPSPSQLSFDKTGLDGAACVTFTISVLLFVVP
ncbi:hypothetical protein D3C73_1529880 [compost metagenome]